MIKTEWAGLKTNEQVMDACLCKRPKERRGSQGEKDVFFPMPQCNFIRIQNASSVDKTLQASYDLQPQGAANGQTDTEGCFSGKETSVQVQPELFDDSKSGRLF